MNKPADLATRDGFGKKLLEYGKDPRLVVLGLDLADATRTLKFWNVFPERYCQVGIQEQHGVSMAAGMALEGLRPFVPSFASFITGRGYDQIRISVAYNHAPVVLVGTHSGLAIGKDGHTQMGIEDLAIMNTIPNIEIFQPADSREAEQITEHLIKSDNMAYLRLSRTPHPEVFGEEHRFQFNKALTLREGKDVAIFATGDVVYNALESAKLLSSQYGIEASVVNFSTLKPIDVETIRKYGHSAGLIFTVEDHSVEGGLGSKVCGAIAKSRSNAVVYTHGINGFGESGDPKHLYRKHRLDIEGITGKVQDFCRHPYGLN